MSESLERDLQIDALCEKFEAALRAGQSPAINDYLAASPERIRGFLGIELQNVWNAFHAEKDASPPSTAETRAAAGKQIGPYKLVSKLGEGGMGEVWVVEQTEPVRRQAALKFIKAGLDSKSVLARFDQEREALALLDNPNIAKVLDAGLTPELRPYFVMDLVKGSPLTTYCDDARLGIPERLALFVTICQAVQHAHQKGIIHRDLKPSNILVAEVDPGAPGLPKIIDFGVAKVVVGGLTNETLATEWGTVVGTLEYMAPEQAGTSSLDIDTRADIYSLGVILYELLTGLRPFDGQCLREASLDQVVHIIREEEPPRPSARLSSGDTLASAATSRQTEPARLTALLRGDLDWIVMKCLEKERGRRYETASSLGRDIERYLASEPVAARPPSAAYRLRKFIRRNKVPVLAASLVLAVLLAAVVGTSLGLVQARVAEAKAVTERNEKEAARQEEERQRRVAQTQKIEADNQRAKAERARDEAGRRLEQVEKGNEILTSIFSDLNMGKIDAQSMLGGALLGQQRYAEAEPHLLKAYEGMQAYEKSIPRAQRRRLAESAERLVSLYTALDKQNEVDKWKSEAAALAEKLGEAAQAP
jgi:serine/threonine protein kinase